MDAEKVKRLIQDKGLKQKYIAEQAGLTEQQLSDILNGRKRLQVEYIMPICSAIGISPNELLEDVKKQEDKL